jgi:hypothetical protein
LAARIALSVAAASPLPPIIVMYIHEIGRIDALPNGAAEIAPIGALAVGASVFDPVASLPAAYRWPGRNRTRCAPTPIGPTPGPPPPCGMQKVLCN